MKNNSNKATKPFKFILPVFPLDQLQAPECTDCPAHLRHEAAYEAGYHSGRT